jgi:Tfp pilus assembly ATPase PilU
MVNTSRISDLIRDNESERITEAVEEGSFHLMQSFSQHLVQLVLEDLVDFETAAAASTNRHDFEIAVDQALRIKKVEDAKGAANADETEPDGDASASDSDPDESEPLVRLATP